MWEQDERAKQCVSQRGREDGGVCSAQMRNKGGEYEHKSLSCGGYIITKQPDSWSVIDSASIVI